MHSVSFTTMPSLVLKIKAVLTLTVFMVLSACSTYKTNTEVTFESSTTRQKPEVFVGQELESYKLDYLGWVEAEVRRPTVFHKRATPEQADIVLARLAKNLGAQGVFFVTYDFDLFGTLHAKGQAVRIEGLDQVANYDKQMNVRVEQEKAVKTEILLKENADNPSVILDTEGDALAQAYMAANPIEQQIAESEPFMVKVPRATLVVTLDQLLLLQDQAQKEKNVALYLAISDMLNGLRQYKDNYVN